MRTHPGITPELRQFIEAQHVFFVATAPLERDGRVNVSPKGLDTFRVLGPTRVAYLDLTGSGNETSAHVAQNGRITFMFCAFDGPPLILRLFGAGRTILPGTAEWQALLATLWARAGARQAIVAEIDRVQTSCGYAVPLLAFGNERDGISKWHEEMGEEVLAGYRRESNVESIDGLPTPLGRELAGGVADPAR